MTKHARWGDEAAGPGAPRFGAYLFAHGAWFLAFGVQMVVFPYLVRIVLHENEVRFGIAQMLLQLPTGLLILVGGFVADRVDRQRILITCCACGAAVFAVLGGFVVGGAVSYELMLFYAISIGILGAFANPARDALLSQVAPARDRAGTQRAVSFASLAQFGGQLAGMAFAATAPFWGVSPLLFGQALLMCVAAYAIFQLHPRSPETRVERGSDHVAVFMARQIKIGLEAAFSSRVIAPVMLGTLSIGICAMGSFFVLVPLIVESELRGHATPPQIASAFAVANFSFWAGSMLSGLVLMRLKRLPHRGIMFAVGLACVGIVLLLYSIRAPYPVSCVLSFAWGIAWAVTTTIGRGIVQEHAPDILRARILSVFTLMLMLAGPLGALTQGFLAHALGPHTAIAIAGVMLIAIIASVAAFTDLRKPEAA